MTGTTAEVLGAGAFEDLLADDVPLIDLRAPAEFALGALPAAVSLPLMTDDERHQVGLTYKQRGQAAAIELGHALVAGDVRAARIAAWLAHARTHPGTVLYCWRGGLRSQTVQQWLRAEGCPLPRIEGGYKQVRQYAMGALDAMAARTREVFVLGGRTGSGKTTLLGEFAASIDLEALARHRGSAFGQRPRGQPTQIDFEHGLLRALLRHHRQPHAATLFEDESRMIGRVALPEPLHLKLKASALVVLEVPQAERAAHIEREYVHEALQELLCERPDGDAAAALDDLRADLTDALGRIERRLGGARHAEIRAQLDAAFASHAAGDTGGHQHWILALLRHYYDPMYDYQLGRNAARVAFRGERDAVRGWLAERLGERLTG